MNVALPQKLPEGPFRVLGLVGFVDFQRRKSELSGPLQDSPRIRAMPCRDSIAAGVSNLFLLAFMCKYC